MKKIMLFVAILFFIATAGVAQNATSRLAVGANWSVIDFYGPDDGGFHKQGNNNFLPGPVNLSLAYNVVKPLNILTTIACYDVRKINPPISKNFMWKWDAGFQFRFLSFIKDDAMFDPYLMLNGGVMNLNKEMSPLVNGGIGMNVWIGENFAITGQTGYNYGFDSDKFYETTLGVKIRLGKNKDMDGDGIDDVDDKCPALFGVKSANGCPDADGDGIADADDKCPNEAGPVATNGCPDADGDGVIDKIDKCPNEPGTVATNGCPDADGDGIIDKDDKCPNEAGKKATNGCPDNDGDGIANADDECPDEYGKPIVNGCPDSDGDGVPDKDDKCPNVIGVVSNHGCPELKAEEKKEIEEELSFVAKNIEFLTGSANLKADSHDDLDKVAEQLKKYPTLKVSIDGYTDNTGKADKNLKLSQDRANSVKQYLISKGIAANRLNAVGHGIKDPIATNKTSAGRAKNRRVEIHILD